MIVVKFFALSLYKLQHAFTVTKILCHNNIILRKAWRRRQSNFVCICSRAHRHRHCACTGLGVQDAAENTVV